MVALRQDALRVEQESIGALCPRLSPRPRRTHRITADRRLVQVRASQVGRLKLSRIPGESRFEAKALTRLSSRCASGHCTPAPCGADACSVCRTVSRILSARSRRCLQLAGEIIICLGPTSPTTSCSLPASPIRRAADVFLRTRDAA